MIVDKKAAEAIKDQMPFVPGGWGTFDDIDSMSVDMRQRLAITSDFKPSSKGPFFTVEMEVTKPIRSSLGFVGGQTGTSGALSRGGSTQIQFDEFVKGDDRNSFLKPVSEPKILR
jgi:filamentous hemagglutinin